MSLNWRARAARAFRARLCRRDGQPVPASWDGVTDLDIEPFLRANGPGVAHVIAAMTHLPKLERMHAHGFVVDVATARVIGPAPLTRRVLQPVRNCIRGEGDPTGGLLLAVHAARYDMRVFFSNDRGATSGKKKRVAEKRVRGGERRMSWVSAVAWEKRRPIVLQPHQKRLQKYLPLMPSPFYIYWGMGSGKTIGGCVCMQALHDDQTCLVLCDKSTVEQWVNETKRFLGCNISDFKRIRVCIQHYEALDDVNGQSPAQFEMVVVDEAHRFRNAWDKGSKRMLGWMTRIHECPRVVFMSGTPIVHDVAIERPALEQMMSTSDLRGRISHYDPRGDEKRIHNYATTDDAVVVCYMTWAQCFRYLLHRKQTFALQLDDECQPRVRMSSSRNTYNTLLRSICNCPYLKNPSLSPKMVAIVERLKAHEGEKQVVYSSRRDTGVTALLGLWMTQTRNKKAVYKIDGSMSQSDRADHISRFNKGTAGVLFITDAGAQGIDLKRVKVMHIMEPADNVQEELQIINRAVRFKAHREKDARVLVLRYLAKFPTSGSVEAPWKTELFESGMFDADEMVGITRRVQYALLRVIRDEEKGLTVDERTIQTRDGREGLIQQELERLKALSIERPSADP